jgi:hypothetical protein
LLVVGLDIEIEMMIDRGERERELAKGSSLFVIKNV